MRLTCSAILRQMSTYFNNSLSHRKKTQNCKSVSECNLLLIYQLPDIPRFLTATHCAKTYIGILDLNELTYFVVAQVS